MDLGLDGGQGLLHEGGLVVGLIEALLCSFDCSLVALDAILLGLNSGLCVSKASVERLRVGERGLGFLELAHEHVADVGRRRRRGSRH